MPEATIRVDLTSELNAVDAGNDTLLILLLREHFMESALKFGLTIADADNVAADTLLAIRKLKAANANFVLTRSYANHLFKNRLSEYRQNHSISELQSVDATEVRRDDAILTAITDRAMISGAVTKQYLSDRGSVTQIQVESVFDGNDLSLEDVGVGLDFTEDDWVVVNEGLEQANATARRIILQIDQNDEAMKDSLRELNTCNAILRSGNSYARTHNIRQTGKSTA